MHALAYLLACLIHLARSPWRTREGGLHCVCGCECENVCDSSMRQRWRPVAIRFGTWKPLKAHILRRRRRLHGDEDSHYWMLIQPGSSINEVFHSSIFHPSTGFGFGFACVFFLYTWDLELPFPLFSFFYFCFVSLAWWVAFASEVWGCCIAFSSPFSSPFSSSFFAFFWVLRVFIQIILWCNVIFLK